jgi:hypothetical protein
MRQATGAAQSRNLGSALDPGPLRTFVLTSTVRGCARQLSGHLSELGRLLVLKRWDCYLQPSSVQSQAFSHGVLLVCSRDRLYEGLRA